MSRLRRRFVFDSPAASSTSPNAIGYQMCRSELNSAAPGTMVIDKDCDIWVKQDHARWELTEVVLTDENENHRLPADASDAEIKLSFARLNSEDSRLIRSRIVTDAEELAKSQDQRLEQLVAAPMAYPPVRYLGSAIEAYLGRR